MDFIFLRRTYVTYVGYAMFAGVKTLLSVIARVFGRMDFGFLPRAYVCSTAYTSRYVQYKAICALCAAAKYVLMWYVVPCPVPSQYLLNGVIVTN